MNNVSQWDVVEGGGNGDEAIIIWPYKQVNTCPVQAVASSAPIMTLRTSSADTMLIV